MARAKRSSVLTPSSIHSIAPLPMVSPRVWRMRPASSVEDFVRAPVGAYLQTERAVFWCSAPDFIGFAAWGNPSPEDVELGGQLWDQIMVQLSRPVDVVIDVRRVGAIMQPTFAKLHEAAGARMPGPGVVRRQLVLNPPGLTGAVVAGFYSLVRAQYEWKCTGDDVTGFAWLERHDAESVRAMIDSLAARGEGDLVPRLRALLVRDLAAASVPAAARALGVSPRSLQRHLAAAGTSFRRELRRARIEAARELLAGTRATVESVARSVGCESPSSFIRMFRSITGETPATFRARATAERYAAA